MIHAKQSPPPSPPLLSHNSSPLPSPTPNTTDRHSATAKRYKFLRRLIYFRHMDFEFAFWQMLYLFISPQKVMYQYKLEVRCPITLDDVAPPFSEDVEEEMDVDSWPCYDDEECDSETSKETVPYRNFQYRKQTKDQFARDDPAFLVLLSFWLIASSAVFSIVLNLGFFGFFKFLLWVIFIDCIGIGLLVATFLWFVSNHYMIKPTCQGQDVEWGYAFDVHLNAFFPLLIILHMVQICFYFFTYGWFVLLFGNALWLLALCYYIYITFLGYSALPILKNTQILLYPTIITVILYIISLIYRVYLCHIMMDFYKYRI